MNRSNLSRLALPTHVHKTIHRSDRPVLCNRSRAATPPSGCSLVLCTGDRTPMRGRDLLDPPQVNGVVDMILLVDVSGHH